MRTILIGVGVLGAVSLYAEGPQPSHPTVDGPAGDRPREPGAMREIIRERIQESLPPEVRQRFAAARKQAEQDPEIQALRRQAQTANEAFLAAMRQAILRADPGLADVVKEHLQSKAPFKGGRMPHRGGEGGSFPGLGQLGEGERQRLMAAREQAANDPAVKAAEAKRDAASGPEERREAMKAYVDALHGSMLATDPSLGPVIEKIRPPGAPGAPAE